MGHEVKYFFIMSSKLYLIIVTTNYLCCTVGMDPQSGSKVYLPDQFSSITAPARLCIGTFPLRGMTRLGMARFGFPLQFSTALEWAGLFTSRYSCVASTAVTSS